MDHLAILTDEVAAMTAALRTTPQSRAVAACPGWTVRELTAHITGVHRWAEAALGTTTAPPPYDESVPDGSDLVDTYAEVARSMLAALGRFPADHPCWTINRHDQTAGFWQRRQLHELSIHRWDLTPHRVTDEVATDGIDEVVDFFLPRQVKTGRTSLPEQTLVLASPSRTWRIGKGPETVVEGSAGDLLLRLWGRNEPLPAPWTQLTP
jgi:uncharacterized protein (TIGR03083 family)